MEARKSRFLTRRRLLASSAIGITTLAGCGGSGSDSEPGTSTETITETPNATATPQSQAEFELREVKSDGVATAGESLTVSAIVANIGDTEGSASVEFSFGEQTLVGDVNLAEGEAKSAIVDIDLTQVDPGRYDLVAEHEGDSLSTSVDVFAADLGTGLHGAVISEAGISLQGNAVELFVYTGEEFGTDRSTLSSGEQFELAHPFEVPYEAELTFVKGSFGNHNGVPAVYDMEANYNVQADSELLGRYEIPEAYRTEVQMVDSNGEPLAGFSAVNFRSQGGSGLGPRTFTTDNSGYVKADDSSETGISVPAEGEGDLTVEARPKDGNGFVEFGTIHGSEDGEEFAFTVSDPGRFE